MGDGSENNSATPPSVEWKEELQGYLSFSHHLTKTNDRSLLNDGSVKPNCFQIALYLLSLKYPLSLVLIVNELSNYIYVIPPPHTSQIQQNRIPLDWPVGLKNKMCFPTPVNVAGLTLLYSADFHCSLETAPLFICPLTQPQEMPLLIVFLCGTFLSVVKVSSVAMLDTDNALPRWDHL